MNHVNIDDLNTPINEELAVPTQDIPVFTGVPTAPDGHQVSGDEITEHPQIEAQAAEAIDPLDFLAARSDAMLAVAQRHTNKPKQKPGNQTNRQERKPAPPVTVRGTASSARVAELLSGIKDGFRDAPQDGVNCINISNDQSSTGAFGHSLSIASPLPFMHSDLGHFSSIEGFLLFISLSPGIEAIGFRDAARTTTGSQIRDLKSAASDAGFLRNNPNKAFLLADALWQRVQTNEDLRRKLIASDLPFRSFVRYRNNNEMRPGMHSETVIWAYSLIRTALKEDKVPDFSGLIAR